MLKEVIKDNEKLRLTHIHSNGNTKCINLVFCSAKGYSRRVKDEDEKESVSDRIKIYIEGRKGVKLYNSSNERQFNPPSEILNIFIESFINSDKKITLKPSTNYFSDMNEPIWANLLIEKLKISNTS